MSPPERVSCPKCPGTMVRGSEVCRACRLVEMKQAFRGYFVKAPRAVMPFYVPYKAGKKFRSL